MGWGMRVAGGSGRAARPIFVLFAGIMVAACGSLLPTETEETTTRFKDYTEVMSAYNQIVPGATDTGALAELGFDVQASPNVEILSYLGVIERFMPRNTMTFDDLDPAVRQCILTRGNCTGYVFHPARKERRRVGNLLLDMLGFQRKTVEQGWSAELTFLVQDGHVTHKIMSATPNIAGMRDRVQPLGPVQDVSGAVAHVAVDGAKGGL